MSELDIYIESKEFTRYGLGRLGGSRQKLLNGWCKLKGLKEIARVIDNNHIVENYVEIIRRFMQDKTK